MRGHLPLIAMRQAGAVPRSVWFAFDGDGWRHWPSSIARPGGVAAEVLVEPYDSIPLLDLRFVVGLLVHVQGDDAKRVRQLHEACRAAKAARVIATVMQPDARGAQRSVEVLDTAEELQEAAWLA